MEKHQECFMICCLQVTTSQKFICRTCQESKDEASSLLAAAAPAPRSSEDPPACFSPHLFQNPHCGSCYQSPYPAPDCPCGNADQREVKSRAGKLSWILSDSTGEGKVFDIPFVILTAGSGLSGEKGSNASTALEPGNTIPGQVLLP